MGKKRCFFQNQLMFLKLQFLELVLVRFWQVNWVMQQDTESCPRLLCVLRVAMVAWLVSVVKLIPKPMDGSQLCSQPESLLTPSLYWCMCLAVVTITSITTLLHSENSICCQRTPFLCS